MTEFGLKDDSTLSPWIFFIRRKIYVISKDKVMVISMAAKELGKLL